MRRARSGLESPSKQLSVGVAVDLLQVASHAIACGEARGGA